ncbi:MAG: trypsin-like peptidase domain-containing protein, partial [Planctomycetota bacterium]
ARGAEFDLAQLQNDVLETIEEVKPAVVSIFGGGTSFSGVIVSPDGHVLSVAHAVRPGSRYRLVLPDGRTFRGIGKGANPRADSALIMINEPGDDLPFVPMGDSSSLVKNQPCIGLSYPGGQKAGREPIVRFGRIMSNGRSRGMFQSSSLMEPGDSGGPLFDLNGFVVGIHSRIGRSMDRNYEVPVDAYRDFWNELNREKTFEQSGPPVPKLGVRCPWPPNRDEDSEGLKIIGVTDGSRAEKSGIQVDDILLTVFEQDMKTVEDLRAALIAARDDGTETIEIELKRGEEELTLNIEFDVDRESAPEVALPEKDFPSVPAEGFSEMARLAKQLSELESDLDDACIEITSELGKEDSRSATGTRILGTPWLVSKSTSVGKNPMAEFDGESVALQVVDRDGSNDLVLLRAPAVHTNGIDLEMKVEKLVAGTFLLTPDFDGDGLISVVGSPTFRSQKQNSRGFLGVVPETYQDNQGAVLNEVTDDGAAKRAGLLVGDVITKLNDTIIRTQRDMRSFLMKADPNEVITATVLRDEDELTKSIVLGAVPTMSRHAADQMKKSSRRDGFTEVLTHDADLKPEDCGGPLFDLEGNFVGLNIARNSRVRSYALTAGELQAFVQRASQAGEVTVSSESK